MKRIRRAIKAGEPNINTGIVMTNLEDELQKYFKVNKNTVFVDDWTPSIRRTCSSFDGYLTVDLVSCIGIVRAFNEEYFFIDLTDYGEKIFSKNIDRDNITGYALGIVSLVNPDDYSTCNKVVRLHLIKDESMEEKEND